MIAKAYYLFVFQRKFILPSVIISVLLGFVGSSINGRPVITNTGLSYLFVLPLFQYFIYELRYPNEYYFYHNLGISKIMLWAACIVHVLVVNIVASLL